MTDHDDGAPRSAPAIDDFMASYENFKRRARALRSANKAALFAMLADAGIAHVIVTFDGCGDNGQIESIAVQGAVTSLPAAMITLAFAQYNGDSIEHRSLSVADAVEEVAYDCLREHHDGWENNDGAFGEFTFDIANGTITLDFNYRITSTDNYAHEF